MYNLQIFKKLSSQKGKKRDSLSTVSLVREAGLEPARAYCTLEPESSESANSTTRAYGRASFSARFIIPRAYFVVNTFFILFSYFACFFQKSPFTKSPRVVIIFLVLNMLTCVRSAMDSASDSGSEGWGFESLRACQKNQFSMYVEG